MYPPNTLGPCNPVDISCEQAPSVLVQLTNRQRDLAKQLADINAAITVLQTNPEIENVLTVLGRAARY